MKLLKPIHVRHKRHARTSKQNGASLLEVMIALFILAVGLLGYVGLITSGLTINQRAYTLTQAMFFAEDFVDRARANRDVISQYRMVFDEPPTTTADCNTNSCSEDQMASWDKVEWWTQLDNTLFNADAEVVIDTDSGKTEMTITISYSLALGKEGTGSTEDMNDVEQYQLITEI